MLLKKAQWITSKDMFVPSSKEEVSICHFGHVLTFPYYFMPTHWNTNSEG